jgi:hypothetical protein
MTTSSSFASLKSSRTSSLDTLAKEMSKMTKKAAGDDRFWKLSTDATKNGSATIRFLPAPTGESVPFVRLWHHAFKGPGGWYFENSLTTLNQNDPVSELNSRLWQEGERGQAKAKEQKRKLKYIANIVVVKDPLNPANDGKVFLFTFGKKIFDKINERLEPQFKEDAPMNPFDLWAGANFKLRMTKGPKESDIPNYDSSTFDIPGPLDTDEKMEAYWSQAHSLQQFIAPSEFKSYGDLKIRLEQVLAMPSTRTMHAPTMAPAPSRAMDETEPEAVERVEATMKSVGASAAVNSNLKFFEDLANED